MRNRILIKIDLIEAVIYPEQLQPHNGFQKLFHPDKLTFGLIATMKGLMPQPHLYNGNDFYGVGCVRHIRDKIGMRQAMTSPYLSLLQQCGLLELKQMGMWMYYRRNEKVFHQLESFSGKN